jgi:hypothetical protein
VKIERVQYDGEGKWLDVVFDDGLKAHLPVGVMRALAELVRTGFGIASTEEEGIASTEEEKKP